jgi:hypothetical protein
MPGKVSHSLTISRLRGSSRGKFPSMPNLPGWFCTASIDRALLAGSQLGGCKIAPSTPAVFISASNSSALKRETCRCMESGMPAPQT